MKYRMHIDVRIESMDDNGRSINQGALMFGQDIKFEADTFLEIAHVLGQFHELAENLKSDGSATK